jgi:hypothetical protein
LSKKLDGAKAVKVQIDVGDGNLTIDGLTGDDQVLANGILQYLDNQGAPNCSVDMDNDQAAFTLKASGKGQPWFRLPWAACNGATEWQIHLNPKVQSDLFAHSDGGNVKLDLTGMDITQVSADTGGGNMDVVLPSNTADMQVTASSGAGNVSVWVPRNSATRIHAATGLGKVMMESRFQKIDDHTYQSPDYDDSASKVEIRIKSGAGNVSVSTM